MLQSQNLQASNVVVNKNEGEDATLSSYSKKDEKWDTHKAKSQDVKAIYSQSPDFEKLAARMNDCANLLKFAWVDDSKTGESLIKLREAQFCRVRYCPTCQWRRSLMNQARFLQALPGVVEKYPRHRWLLLTLTVRNCNIHELKSTLKDMNKGWDRLRLRSEFRMVTGWVRSTEVTRGADGSAHPHFHVLLMVPPSMFGGKNYVTQSRWTALWKETAKLDYQPVVDIRAIKSKGDKSQNGGVVGAIETLKYAVKSTDMTADPSWFLELTRQTFKLRFLAAGGALKEAIRKKDIETDQDMVHAGDNDEAGAEDDGSRIAFNFRKQERKYRRFKKGDKSQNDGQ